MQASTFTYPDYAGVEIFVYKWTPDAGISPKAVVQISHGMAEHAGRYERVAEALTKAGYIVYADDHRGHGKTAKELDKAGQLGPDGWEGTVKAIRNLTELIHKENPNLPVFLLGHSWGSFMSQDYIQNWGDDLKGVILSGTNGKQGMIGIGTMLTQRQIKKNGENAPGDLMNKMSFGSYNKAFKPNKTEFDWLSRDEAEVQKYLDDPWCGFICPNSYFLELLIGLKKIWNPENEQKIPTDLPIYFMAGALDPVSTQTKGIEALIKRYSALGIKDLSKKYYPGGRHEMFNETNRDEVYEDVIAWLDAHMS